MNIVYCHKQLVDFAVSDDDDDDDDDAADDADG